jgi:hypothetical protein
MNRNTLSAGLSLVCLLALGGSALAIENNGQASAAEDRDSSRAISSGNCDGLTATKFKADTDVNDTTASGSFVTIHGTSIAFNQSAAGCVIVTFSSESYVEFDRLMFVRARLDGAKTAAPGAVQFSGDDDEDEDGRWARSRSYTFIFPSVATGNHTVTMEFRSRTFGRAVHLGKHTTVVQHR